MYAFYTFIQERSQGYQKIPYGSICIFKEFLKGVAVFTYGERENLSTACAWLLFLRKRSA
jgi:hypothetical protein